MYKVFQFLKRAVTFQSDTFSNYFLITKLANELETGFGRIIAIDKSKAHSKGKLSTAVIAALISLAITC